MLFLYKPDLNLVWRLIQCGNPWTISGQQELTGTTLLSLRTPAAADPTINLSRPDDACNKATPLVSNYLVLRPLGN